MEILFLSPWFPTPPVNGSKLRIYHLLKALSAQHTVTLVSFFRPGETLDEAMARKMCAEVRTVPYREFQPHSLRASLAYFSPLPRSVVDVYSKDMARVVRELAVNKDAIVASEITTAYYALCANHSRWIFDEVELAVGKDAWVVARGLTRILRYLTWYKNKRYIRHLLNHFTAATVVSDVEKRILEEAAPRFARVEVIPNGVDQNYNRPGMAAPIDGRMVYAGALTYHANYDAVKYFLQEIFPLIRQQKEHACLVVTGSTQNVDISGLRIDDHVQFTGFVEDIRPVVCSASVCVVPLRQGGGTRLKILEAMALGVPVVSTTKGAEGLAVTPGQDILIANQAEDFACQVIKLFNDMELHRRLAENGRRLVEKLYSWDEIGNRFVRLVGKVAKS